MGDSKEDAIGPTQDENILLLSAQYFFDRKKGQEDTSQEVVKSLLLQQLLCYLKQSVCVSSRGVIVSELVPKQKIKLPFKELRWAYGWRSG